MALWKIFLVFLVAIIVEIVVLKYWREIPSIILWGVLMILVAVLGIVFLPINIILSLTNYYSIEKVQKRINKKYDFIFYKAHSKKLVKRQLRRVHKLEKQLNMLEKQEIEKRNKEVLKECK